MKRGAEGSSSCGSSSSVKSPRRRRRRLHMEKGKKVTNFKWGKNHSRFFINFLAEEARAGRKVDKCFKSATMVAAAKAVNQNFLSLNVFETNCVNHYRMLKTRWALIWTLKNLSGVSWDENSKTIIMRDEQYLNYIEAHANAEPFINKSIDEELSLICSDDYATRSFARSIGEPVQTNTNGIGPSQCRLEDMDTSLAGPNAGATKKSGSKRSRNMVAQEGILKVAKGLGEVAKALRTMLNPDLQFSNTLYAAVMEMREFSDSILDGAYDHLMDRKHEALKFITRGHVARANWLDKFFLEHL